MCEFLFNDDNLNAWKQQMNTNHILFFQKQFEMETTSYTREFIEDNQCFDIG